MFSELTIKKTEKQFEKFSRELPEAGKLISEALEGCSDNEGLLLKYLYCSMPLSDAADYDLEMFLEFAAHAAFLRENPPVKSKVKIPDDIFLDYVAYHRVNTEGLTSCRPLFYNQIINRIHQMKMKEAILEINYWCAEEVTYQSTDDRTLSAESVWKSAVGRCGEESVFTVNALRSAGIPARQVYAHRWAHCDDNHAWVEVWCEGKWRFLGACEPEEILDRGWFCNASSRSMMINSRIFGAQSPDGEIVEINGMTSAVSQLHRYAQTVRLDIIVRYEDGSCAVTASICMELLNYAEFVPVIRGHTDKAGRFSVNTGKGSLLITAKKDEFETSVIVDAGSRKPVSIILKKENAFYPGEKWKEFDMTAPADAPVNHIKPTLQQLEKGEMRFAEATAKRKEKERLFPKAEDGMAVMFGKGNHEEIRKFLSVSKINTAVKQDLLSVLPEKDFRDATADVLVDHAENASKWAAENERGIFLKYILNPRIELEQPSCYRSFIEKYFADNELKKFKCKPETIWKWISERISEYPEKEYNEIVTTPVGCLRVKAASARSKKILFVAVCRTLGIPARLHPADGRMQYMAEGKFRDIIQDFPSGTAESLSQAELSVIAEDSSTKWVYMQNWSLSVRKNKGIWKTINISADDIRNGISLAAGIYRVITTNRLPNGNQFAAVKKFCLKAGEKKQIHLRLRNAQLSDMLEQIPLESFELKARNGDRVQISGESVKGKSDLFIWLEVGKEPTEHILNELMERKSDFSSMQSRIHLILKNEQDLKDSTFQKLIFSLPETEILFDDSKRNINIIARRMYGDPDKLPLILVIKQGMFGVYSTGGYNVGTGDLLLRIMKSDI